MDKHNQIYTLLTSCFCSIVVASNLIFQKFVNINFFNLYAFELSVGVFFYPVTFIITDLITEFYGKAAASQTVKISIIATFMVMILVIIGDNIPSVTWSPVDDVMFTIVFQVYGLAAFASLLSSYIAQKTDIHIFSLIKGITGEKKLWLRSNVSTIVAQFVDTSCIVTLLCLAKIIPSEKFLPIAISSFIFKFFAAILSTPVFYGLCNVLKKANSQQQSALRV